MSEVNIEPLSKADTEYIQLSDPLKAKFDCEWDDSVHESFRIYIKAVNQISEGLNRNTKTAVSLFDSVEALQIDKLETQVNSLIDEVNAV